LPVDTLTDARWCGVAARAERVAYVTMTLERSEEIGTLKRMNYLWLAIAIVSEVVATSALKASNGFSRLAPSLVVVLGYGTAFYFLSLALRSIPVGVAYAIWSGAGIALVTAVAWILFDQRLDPPALVGLSLIIAGVLILNVFSKSAAH